MKYKQEKYVRYIESELLWFHLLVGFTRLEDWPYPVKLKSLTSTLDISSMLDMLIALFRFETSSSEKSFADEKTRTRPSASSFIGIIRSGFRKSSKGAANLKIPRNVISPSEQSNKELDIWNKILDPQGLFLQQWNKIFVLACVLSMALDPLFFYVPVFDKTRSCLNLDNQLKITACVLRTFTDIFYILHIIFQFRTGFIAPSSRVFGRGELVVDPHAIAKRYLATYFTIDILAILPLPQMVVLVIIPNENAMVIKNMLKFVIFCQYIPRAIRIYPLYKEVTRTSGILAETAWAGAAFNLFLYMLASHLVGAFWYLFAIERKDQCWRDALCKPNVDNCDTSSLYFGTDKIKNSDSLSQACPLLEPDKIRNKTDFNFGIFFDALQSNVVEMTDFPKKFLYCFWWGLRGVSSLGQNLKTSSYVPEILFAVAISVIGLVLFSLLIGNMQKYLQSLTFRVEEMRVKRRDAELWMSHRMLPENLRERIRRNEQYRWQETRGVDEEFLLRNLPKDVPMFKSVDEQLLDAMCDHLKPVLYTEQSYIVREGDPVDEMLFVMRGKILTATTNGGRTGFFNSVYLQAGEFCGKELLPWALDPNSSSSIPISTRTVQSVSDVEALALMTDDLKSVASQFRRLHSRQLQHTFRQQEAQDLGKGVLEESDSDDSDEDDSNHEMEDRDEKSDVIDNDISDSRKEEGDATSGSVTGGNGQGESSVGCSSESYSEEEKNTLENGQLQLSEEFPAGGALNQGNRLKEPALEIHDESMVLGMERLKSELQERGLKCGGTSQERTARLFLLKTTPFEKLQKKLLAKK